MEKQIPDTMKARNLTAEQVSVSAPAAQPTKEFVTVDQVAALALFLASDAAASITGADYTIDGAWTAGVEAGGAGRTPNTDNRFLVAPAADPCSERQEDQPGASGGGATAAAPGVCSTTCWPTAEWPDRGHLRRLGRRHERHHAGRRPRARRPAGAQKRLAEFWRAASLSGNLPPLQRAALDRMLSFLPLEGTPAQAWLGALSHLYSPYDVNPLNINPLRDVIERFVDFGRCATAPTCNCSYPRPTSSPAGCGFLRVTTSPPRRCWHPPACRCCSARSRSTACRIGMAAISAIR